jgi:hypothetical protein
MQEKQHGIIHMSQTPDIAKIQRSRSCEVEDIFHPMRDCTTTQNSDALASTTIGFEIWTTLTS